VPQGNLAVQGAKTLVKGLEKMRKKRDKAVNNSRTKNTTHIPNPRRGRKDILDELT
jgi:hypothetical protein